MCPRMDTAGAGVGQGETWGRFGAWGSGQGSRSNVLEAFEAIGTEVDLTVRRW